MKISIASLAAASMFAATLSLGTVGCANKTEGDRTEMQARDLSSAADMIKSGEQQQADGKATLARGQAIKDQGNQAEGERLMNEGMAEQKSGEAKIDQGKSMRDKAKM